MRPFSLVFIPDSNDDMPCLVHRAGESMQEKIDRWFSEESPDSDPVDQIFIDLGGEGG